MGAFFALDSERPVSETIAYIPRSAVVAYGREFGLTSDTLEDFVYYVVSMDQDHVKRISDNIKRTQANAANPSKSGRGIRKPNRPVKR